MTTVQRKDVVCALRPVETIFVPHRTHGRVLVLRDTEGLTTKPYAVPGAFVPIVARFDGTRSAAQIAKEATLQLGEEVNVSLVERLAHELDEAYFLESPRAARLRDDVRRAFRAETTRAASHAGGAYPGERAELSTFLSTACFEREGAEPAPKRRPTKEALVALVAPHIDPYRGARGYGAAYRHFAAEIPEQTDTIVLLGTCHAPMDDPFALTHKDFETPLGRLECDRKSVDFLAKRANFDAFRSELLHKREHSLEFQAVMLKHALGNRNVNIVPILAGLGAQQRSGKEPRNEALLDALQELALRKKGSLVFVAGADLAHVGPRFGDSAPLDPAQRDALAETDRASLEFAIQQNAGEFWRHVWDDLEERRVCGLAPMYSLLRALSVPTRGELLHYEQNVDDDDGSIVSFASLAFYKH